MNDAMTDRDKVDAGVSAQPFGGDRGRRRHISDFGRWIRFVDQGGPVRRFCAQAAAARRFRRSVLLTGDGAARVPNLKDLKLDTRGARVDDQNRVHAAHAAVMLADLRRAAA